MFGKVNIASKEATALGENVTTNVVELPAEMLFEGGVVILKLLGFEPLINT